MSSEDAAADQIDMVAEVVFVVVVVDVDPPRVDPRDQPLDLAIQHRPCCCLPLTPPLQALTSGACPVKEAKTAQHTYRHMDDSVTVTLLRMAWGKRSPLNASSAYASVSLPLCFCLSSTLYLPVSLPFSLCLCLCLFVFLPLSVCLSVYL